MISPELFRRFFQPRYRRLFKVIHECGWHVWMHSCGKINKAIGPLIEAGLDVVNMQQPRTNGIEEIGREYAGKITFETLCDIQMTLPAGDREQIVREAEQLMHTWGTAEGVACVPALPCGRVVAHIQVLVASSVCRVCWRRTGFFSMLLTTRTARPTCGQVVKPS